MTTDEFIHQFREADVRQLALRGKRYPDVDLPFALNQIQGWQTARQKLPHWAATEGIIYPPHVNMEQCSSEVTARYKRSVLARWGRLDSICDLTGGFGVDLSTLADLFASASYVERNSGLCDLVRHNLSCLGLSHVSVHCADAATFLHGLTHCSVIFLDPSRRDDHGGRVFYLADCSPDVTSMADELLSKADVVMLKLSPMLDWHEALSALPAVREVHIVAVDNECKDLLLVLSSRPSPLRLFCANEPAVFACDEAELRLADVPLLPADGLPAGYLFEPNAAVMKAGVFAALCRRFGVVGVGPNSHLFFSDRDVSAFPGRRFRILSVFTMNKRDLRTHLSGLTHANISVRNFPLPVAALRKRLRLADGGACYLFATTLTGGRHVILSAEKCP